MHGDLLIPKDLLIRTHYMWWLEFFYVHAQKIFRNQTSLSHVILGKKNNTSDKKLNEQWINSIATISIVFL